MDADFLNNGARYRDMIIQFFVPKLQDMDVDDMWFHQQDATCHTAREIIHLLLESFSGRVISRFGHQNWPSRSCDLKPFYFFLWCFLKFKVNANNLTTSPPWRRKLRAEIQQHLCKKIMENFDKRVRWPAKSWRQFTRYPNPYVTLYCILYESIKNLQFLIKSLCFLSKLLLAWILGHPLLLMSKLTRILPEGTSIHQYNIIVQLADNKNKNGCTSNWQHRSTNIFINWYNWLYQ